MSNRCGVFTGQLLKNWAAGMAAALEGDCALCGGAAAGLVCTPCEAALPRLGPCCRRCAQPLPCEGVCGACVDAAPAFDAAIAAYAYRFPVDRLVQRFKF